MLGDSFSIYSFVMLAVACARKWLPRITYQHLANRMGCAPGFRPILRCRIPLQRKLASGSPKTDLLRSLNLVEQLNRLLLGQTNHTGSDVRIISGQVYNSKIFPRESVCAQWWKWESVFHTKWKQTSHINVLEIEAILLAIKHQILRRKAHDLRIFQLSDSYVAISVLAKGRSSSLQLQRVIKKVAAHLLGHNLFLILAHVDSSDNPTDTASRL